MRPLSTVMGGDFKSVTNATNGGPVTVLIVRHQFMRKSDQLVFLRVSRHTRRSLQLKLYPCQHYRSVSLQAASVRRTCGLTPGRLNICARAIAKLLAIRF